MTERVGVIGAGQLAQMLGEAAGPLDLKILALTTDPNACAKNTVELVMGDEHDPHAVKNLASQVDVITFEHEHIKGDVFKDLDFPLHPNVAAVRIAQNRGLEKNFFQDLGIPTPKFEVVNSAFELEQAIKTIGFPCVLKTVEGGYDGKGQKVLKQKTDLHAVWQELGAQTLIIEAWVKFEREVSLVAARALDGEIVFYPLTENQHRDGILRVSKAPCQDVKLQQFAETYLTKILQKLNYVGVLAVEFFHCGDHLVANEMAPRVHNSGHWSIEGAATSQFSNHLRAVTGKSLGATNTTGFSAMINIIGQWPDKKQLEKFSWLHIHDYGKAPRPGRKLGHLTIVAATEKERDAKLQQLLLF